MYNSFSVVMLTTIIPTGIYVQEEEYITNQTAFENVEDVGVEYKIESKRTENSKTYLTENGSYYQVSAAVPIHKEVNGEWEEIEKVIEKMKQLLTSNLQLRNKKHTKNCQEI